MAQRNGMLRPEKPKIEAHRPSLQAFYGQKKVHFLAQLIAREAEESCALKPKNRLKFQ